MKISVPTRKIIDIGPLDHFKELPMAGRKARNMKTICDRCRKPIEDTIFVAGWKEGYKPMKFHKKCFIES